MKLDNGGCAPQDDSGIQGGSGAERKVEMKKNLRQHRRVNVRLMRS